MKTLWTLLAISLIWCILAFSCNSPQTPGNSGPGPDQHTKKGVTVVSPVVVPDAALDVIDRGVEAQWAMMPKQWTAGRDYKSYPVHFVAPDLHNQDGSPALHIVDAQGNEQQSAGTVRGTLCGHILNGVSGPAYLALPHQQAENWQYLDYLAGSVAAESQHLSEALNDCNVFLHFAGIVDRHPHTYEQFYGP